jgi:glutamate racemase
MNQDKPRSSFKKIGLIDSGLGGLTILQKLIDIFPAKYLYLADTKNLPYGEKTPEQLIKIAHDNIRFLILQDVDAIVIACHTLATVVTEIKDLYPGIVFYDVIEPIVRKVVTSGFRTIGLLATAASIKAGTHKRKLVNIDPSFNIIEQACPDLVPLIEQFPCNELLINEKLIVYLEPLIQARVEAIILGCTHYSLVQHNIQNIIPQLITLISAEQEIILDSEYNTTQPSKIEIYVTKHSGAFELNCRNILSRGMPPLYSLQYKKKDKFF